MILHDPFNLFPFHTQLIQLSCIGGFIRNNANCFFERKGNLRPNIINMKKRLQENVQGERRELRCHDRVTANTNCCKLFWLRGGAEEEEQPSKCKAFYLIHLGLVV